MESRLCCRKKQSMSSSMNGDNKGVADPDNVPPQSRLFIVVPKTSDGSLIEVSPSVPSLLS